MDTVVGPVPQISTTLCAKDSLGTLRARLGTGRDDYSIVPGLYAIGSPDQSSPVLVTANYKLTFDYVRKELAGISAWLVILDTKGVNVWCAAGKGTFCTEEVVGRINFLKLRRLVSHKNIILPQLSAPGVSAFEVSRRTGFKSVFGPVRAEDLPKFIESGMQATKDMRVMHFTLMDRAVLTPIEFTHSLKLMLAILSVLFVWNSFSPEEFNLFKVIYSTMLNFIPYLVSVLLGCVIVPILLPYLPFRHFYFKGLTAGILWAAFVIGNPVLFALEPTNVFLLASKGLLIPVITAFLSFNFTGSTTYTSFSGVKKEMNLVLKPTIAAVVLGLVLFIAAKAVRFI